MRICLRLLFAVCALAPAAAYAATASDLQVTDYSFAPAAVGTTGVITFSITVTNNGPDTIGDAVLVVHPSTLFTSVGSLTGCAAGSTVGAGTITCNVPSTTSGHTQTITYQATAQTTGAVDTDASVSSATNVDPNPGNDSLTITPSVFDGVDLSLTQQAQDSTNIVISGPQPAGSTVKWVLTPRNNSAFATAAITITDTLPPTSDFTLTTNLGSVGSYSCSQSGLVVTCVYTGSTRSNANYPTLTLTGTIKATSGSISNNASVAVNSPTIVDPDTSNNQPLTSTINVSPGADLQATKTMASKIILDGSLSTMTLTIKNNGPSAVTQPTITDTIQPEIALFFDATHVLDPECNVVGATITCTPASLAASGGASSKTYTFAVKGVSVTASQTNTATVALKAGSGLIDGVASNNSSSRTYQVLAPSALLTIDKVKAGPGGNGDAVAPGDTITSTILVTNDSAASVSGLTYNATTPLVVTDTLTGDETFPVSGFVDTSVGATASRFTCVRNSATVVTCTTNATGTLTVGSSLKIVLKSIAGSATTGALGNNACTKQAALQGDNATVASTGSALCTTASIPVSTSNANVSIVKTVSRDNATYASSGVVVGAADNDLYVKLVVTNTDATTTSTNITVSDDMSAAGFMTGTPSSTFTQVSLTSTNVTPPSETPTYGTDGKVSWVIPSLAPGDAETLIFKVSRPLNYAVAPTTFSNTATLSPGAIHDTNPADNSSTATYSIVPLADVGVVATPNPITDRVGVTETYTLNVSNSGPNDALNVHTVNSFDTTRFSFQSATVTGTTPAPICSQMTAGTTLTIDCDLGKMASGASYQVIQKMLPLYPFGGVSSFPTPVDDTNTTTVTTSSVDTNAGNDTSAALVHIDGPKFDLQITDTEPAASGGVTYDPIPTTQDLTYNLKVINNGPSQASNVRVEHSFTTVPAGFTVAFHNMSIVTVGSYVPPAPSCTDMGSGQIECVLSTTTANNNLPAGASTIFQVNFTATAGTPLTGSTTFKNQAYVIATEQPDIVTAAAETSLANNKATQTTTMLPATDLEVIKTADLATATIDQPITYTLNFANNGPSPTTQVRLVDTLPAGLTMIAGSLTQPVLFGTSTASGSASCTGTTTITCVVSDTFAGDATTSRRQISFKAKAAYPYAPALGTVTNSVTISPGTVSGSPISGDSVSTNNTSTVNVALTGSSISGTVFVDQDISGTITAGDVRYAGATITLSAPSGTDLYGTTFSPITTVTDGSGNFSFTKLPPGTYKLVETQPGGLVDGDEIAGTSGGDVTASNSGHDSTAAHNTITNIVLPAATDATDYLFQEIPTSSISGNIYADANNNGVKDGGETGIPASSFASTPHLRLTGTDVNGTAVNLTTSVDASGQYSFTNLAPSTSGYTVTEEVQPTGYADGKDHNGLPAPGGAVVANSGGRAAPESIVVGAVTAGQTVTNVDFGELASASLSGSVYLDADGNAVRGGTETSGIAGAVVTLSGTDSFGNAITPCAITTGATGAFSFPDAGNAVASCHVLSPGTYTLTETPPSGFTHTGAYVGSVGGTAGAVSTANTPSVGAGVTSIGAITVAVGDAAINYNFGETGQGFAGFVYVDRNNNGTRDAGETGIAGVTVTLSGTTGTAQNVCSLITCTATTDAAGNFIIPNVPGSDATGYTLTEQSQATAPLNTYGDGQDGAGTVSGTPRGTAGNDVISGIVIATGELGTNYRFGELASSLSGRVYVDSNANGTFQAGELGIPGVIVTLSGTTSGGANICTQRAALSPALTCTVTTAADGSYSFADLPAGSYTLVESQPSAYLDGQENAGTPAGTVNNAAFGSTAATNTIANVTLPAGTTGTTYDFGEIGVTLNGRVYKDPQRDGVDSGGSEPGIQGVIVTLMQGVTVIATTTTDSTGAFHFIGLAAGSYDVVETQPAGYGSSTPNNFSVNLTAGATQTVEFGETVSTIAGHVFVDANNDGIFQTGETPIPGVTVTLGGSATQTVVTDAAGSFLFSDLLGGTYTLTETQPANFGDGKDSAGSAGGTVGNDVVSAIALNGGIDAVNYAFGELTTSIGGTVYVDTNLNGKQDTGEPGIPGVTLTLQKPDGTVLGTTTTDADGKYSFPVPGTGDYVVVETQPGGYGDAAENNSNHGPIAVGTGVPPSVNFGEREGSISGLVYDDANFNNRRDPGEPVIAGVTLTLTGTDGNGQPVTRTTVSGRDGTYQFTNVAGGHYTIVETQPAGWQDSGDTPGTAGGSALPSPGDTISGIALGVAQDATGYLFGEHGPGAELSGSVWFDADHDGVRDPNEIGQPNWTVQLLLDGVVVNTTTTDATGQYKFTGLPPGSGYSLLFREPSSQAAFGSARPNETGLPASDGVISAGNPGGADFSTGQIRQITLLPGANVQQQSLPLDPSGVVYDSVTRQVVPGSVVSIAGPAGFDPATQLLGGAINARQAVGKDGFYQFLLLPGAPNGVYTITYTPPAGGAYNQITPSTRILPCTGPYVVGPTPDPLLISNYDGAPPQSAVTSCTVGQDSTAYFLSFTLTAGVSANVVNNNLPLDPILKGSIVVTKTTPLRDTTRGGLVPYTITAKNILTATLPGISVVDQVPAGFRYRTGSARLAGAPVTPVENGRQLTFPPVNFAAGETKTYDLILTVGAGVGDGEHVNQAWAVNVANSQIISNVADATVIIQPDADFDCTDIIGKVFDDRNGNGVQDEGEPGLPGARVVTVAGDLITTDREGRYHITCPMIANADRGSNFILKLDTRTLPTGYRVTTDNPETVRLTQGKFVKLNFGAALLRVVRLDVQDAVFHGEDIAPDYRAKVDALIATLEGQPSILRIAYIPRGEDPKLVHARVARLKALIEHKWGEKSGRCRLIVEAEESW